MQVRGDSRNLQGSLSERESPFRPKLLQISAISICVVADSEKKMTAVRSIHLQGGCRANDTDLGLRLEQEASNGKIAQFALESWHHAYGRLRAAGFAVIGADFYVDVDQFDGIRPPEWRAHHRLRSTRWPCADQADQWSFIARSAVKVGNGPLWDVASRVSHQLRTCDWRLREVSEAYRSQLNAQILSNSFVHGQRFIDGFTWLSYLSIQAFLVDACTLRDYLAEYRALVLMQVDKLQFKTKITRLSPLKRQYLSKGDLFSSIDQKLNEESDPTGWLHTLGAYRDLVVHYAPLASAGRRLYAICVSMQFDGQVSVPSIKLPIPPDPVKISTDRTAGRHLADPNRDYARFLSSLEDPTTAQDGLLYCHASLGRLAQLASDLGTLSPVKAEVPVITDEEIVGVELTRPNV